jgi:HAD superfamily hydrolase (TIGR01459 family)
MRRLPGIDTLLPLYDAFIVDQFGTLHDGHALYPGAEAALRRLRSAGKRVLLLSNSGKRGTDNVRRMARLGIAPDAYEACLTSGEVAWHLLAQGRIDVARDRRRCLLLERDGDGTLLDGTGLTAVAPERAELVVIAGSEGDRRTLDQYADLLAPLARRGLPALCVNPDRTMLTPAGPTFGAGRIAELYQSFGGSVAWVGKPSPEVYAAALAMLDHPAPARVACFGDSVEHDVAGARGAGCAAWLVRAGIIAGADDAAIDAECRRYGVTPDGMLDAFA